MSASAFLWCRATARRRGIARYIAQVVQVICNQFSKNFPLVLTKNYWMNLKLAINMEFSKFEEYLKIQSDQIWAGMVKKNNIFMYFNANLYYRLQNRLLLSQYKHANQCAQIWYRRSHNYKNTSCSCEASWKRRQRALPLFLPRRSCTREGGE